MADPCLRLRLVLLDTLPSRTDYTAHLELSLRVFFWATRLASLIMEEGGYRVALFLSWGAHEAIILIRGTPIGLFPHQGVAGGRVDHGSLFFPS